MSRSSKERRAAKRAAIRADGPRRTWKPENLPGSHRGGGQFTPYGNGGGQLRWLDGRGGGLVVKQPLQGCDEHRQDGPDPRMCSCVQTTDARIPAAALTARL